VARILVIDDDVQFRSMVRKLLEREGYEVLDAPDGERGITLFERQGADLIITDIVMPHKEGLETIMELRRKAPHLNIIAVSGGGRIGPESYLHLAEKFGAVKVFSKPFDLKAFLHAVQEVLSV
jgi:DNA-binding response OmpR family regulator